MSEVSTIGLDIAKSVFQVHGVDVDGTVVIRKRIRRAKLLEFFASLPACLVGITGNSAEGLWNPALVGYVNSRSPQQMLFGASFGPCRGLCPTEGATETGMCNHNTS